METGGVFTICELTEHLVLNFVSASNGPVGRLHVSSVGSTFPGPSLPATVPRVQCRRGSEGNAVREGWRRRRSKSRTIEAGLERATDTCGALGLAFELGLLAPEAFIALDAELNALELAGDEVSDQPPGQSGWPHTPLVGHEFEFEVELTRDGEPDQASVGWGGHSLFSA